MKAKKLSKKKSICREEQKDGRDSSKQLNVLPEVQQDHKDPREGLQEASWSRRHAIW